MAVNDVVFNGSSRFSADFQQVIQRAIGIASLPMLQLQSDKTHLSDQATALSSLDKKFEALQTALSSLNTAAGSDQFNTSISNGSVVKATASGTVLAGTYSVEVVDFGSQSNALSLQGLPVVADPTEENISSASSFTLTVDGASFTVEPAEGTLLSLADAINAAGAGVTATVINVGPAAAPDYRLSLQTEALGSVPIQLNDGSQDLLSTVADGTPLLYRINGQPSDPIASNSRSATLAPGLTVDFLGAGTANITVSRSTSNLANALSSFVASFNASVSELDLHRGTGAGVLSGQALLRSLADSLRDLGIFSSGSGSISSLADLGIAFNQQGKLAFDPTTVNAATPEQFQQIRSLLGSASSGGFLQHAAGILDGIENASKGIIEVAVQSINKQLTRQDELIEVNQRNLEAMATSLQARMAAADAVIASLEQQVQQVTAIFDAIREGQNLFKR